VQRKECRKTRVVASADEIQTIVHERERKARTNFQSRHDGETVGSFDFAISEKTMRYIERQRAVLIRAHDEGRKVAEEIVRRIQTSLRFGPHIRNVPIMEAPVVIERKQLEFIVS